MMCGVWCITYSAGMLLCLKEQVRRWLQTCLVLEAPADVNTRHTPEAGC